MSDSAENRLEEAVTRFHLVDHRASANPRATQDFRDVSVELSYQDNGRTLKVFLVDPPPALPPTKHDLTCPYYPYYGCPGPQAHEGYAP